MQLTRCNLLTTMVSRLNPKTVEYCLLLLGRLLQAKKKERAFTEKRSSSIKCAIKHMLRKSKIGHKIAFVWCAGHRVHPLLLPEDTPCKCAHIDAPSFSCISACLSLSLLCQQLSQHVVQDASILKVCLLDLEVG